MPRPAVAVPLFFRWSDRRPPGHLPWPARLRAARARRKFGWPWKSRRRGPSPAQY